MWKVVVYDRYKRRRAKYFTNRIEAVKYATVVISVQYFVLNFGLIYAILYCDDKPIEILTLEHESFPFSTEKLLEIHFCWFNSKLQRNE